MFKSRLLIGLCAVSLPLTLASASAAETLATSASGPIAATSAPQSRPSTVQSNQSQVRPGDNNRDRRRRPPAPNPEQIRQQAQAAATAAGLSCQATEAAALGVTPDTGAAMFEVACATGPGYIVVNSTPPQTYDCVELLGAAEQARLADPNATAGQQCTLPVNLDALRVIRQYAVAAGVSCTVDQASAVRVGNYEIGCAGADGYWLSRETDGSWNKMPCWYLTMDNLTCRFTDASERLSAWRPMVANTAASACDVSQYRRVGIDARRQFIFELKCQDGSGWFVRVSPEFETREVLTCTEAANIGREGNRGCQL